MNDHCTDGLKNRLLALPDFETSIRDDPLALLQAIKTCVHENAVTQHPPITVSRHWDRLLNLKQNSEEDHPSYAKCFEQQLDTVKGYIGNTFTDGFAEQIPACKASAYKCNSGKIAALLDTHVTDETKITTLLDTHVTDKDAHAKLSDDPFDLLAAARQALA